MIGKIAATILVSVAAAAVVLLLGVQIGIWRGRSLEREAAEIRHEIAEARAAWKRQDLSQICMEVEAK